MENTMRRVVVTGLGVISPVGNTVEACWNSLKSGVHGIGPITLLIPQTTRPRSRPR